MTGPGWLIGLLAALTAGSAVLHAGRLVAASRAGRPHPYAVDAAHLLMSAGMAAMLLLPLDVRQATRWALVATVPTLWWAGRLARGYVRDGHRALGQPARQVLMGVAMVAMLATEGTIRGPATAGGTGSMAGMPAGAGAAAWTVPAAALLAVLLAGVAVQHARELRVALRVGQGGGLLGRGPTVGAQLVMTAAMAWLLVPVAT